MVQQAASVSHADAINIGNARIFPASRPSSQLSPSHSLAGLRAIPGRRNRSRSHLRSLGPSRCAGALLGTWMEDTGGKSGRRPGRHLQVEASGPGNVASVHSAPRVDPNASAWGCASEGWAGSPVSIWPPGADGACEPPRLSIYPADADLQVFFLTCAPYRALWGIVLAQMAGPSVSGAWSFQAHLQASDLGHP